eukprot:121560_1
MTTFKERVMNLYANLSQHRQRDLKIFGIGTTFLFGGTLVYLYYKKKQNEQSHQVINNMKHKNKSLLPFSARRVFLGSYIMSSCTYLLIFSSRFSDFCNKYIPRIMTGKYIKSKLTKTITKSLPPIPRTISQAFQLGKLEQSLIYLESISGDQTKAINEILSNATKILKYKSTISPQQLHGIADRIFPTKPSQIIKTQSVTKVDNIFQFVNMMWGLSIIGISVTVIPVIYTMGKPIWIEIYNFFKKFLIKTGKILYSLLFNEISYTIYEMIGYTICWYFIYLGSEKNIDTNIGLFTTLTGLGLWLPIYGISSARHTSKQIESEEYMSITALIISVLTAPIAYKFDSKPLSALTICSLYAYLTVRTGIEFTSLVHTSLTGTLSYKYNNKPLGVIAVSGLYPYLHSFVSPYNTVLIMSLSTASIAYKFNCKLLSLISVSGLGMYFGLKKVRISIITGITSLMTAFIAYKFNCDFSGAVAVSGVYFALNAFIYKIWKKEELIESRRATVNDLLHTAFASSFIVNIGLIGLKLKGVNVEKYSMFIVPSCIFGCVGMYSTLLSFASAAVDRIESINIKYWQRQCIIILCLIGGVGIGKLLQFPAMHNTALVYSVLYILHKMGESEILWKDKNLIFSIFGSSILTWRIALYLHKNPGVVQQTLVNTIKFDSTV